MKWVQLCGTLNILWHCPFLGLEWKLTFSSPVTTAEFPSQICWHIECNTLTTSSFRILNSLARILFISNIFVHSNLPKGHLTSHSRMSGSRWVATPLWLSGSLRPFLYIYSMCSWYLFLIFSISVRSLPFPS